MVHYFQFFCYQTVANFNNVNLIWTFALYLLNFLSPSQKDKKLFSSNNSQQCLCNCVTWLISDILGVFGLSQGVEILSHITPPNSTNGKHGTGWCGAKLSTTSSPGFSVPGMGKSKKAKAKRQAMNDSSFGVPDTEAERWLVCELILIFVCYCYYTCVVVEKSYQLSSFSPLLSHDWSFSK